MHSAKEETAKEKRARERAERDAAKQSAKQAAGQVRLAEAVAGKLSPAILAIKTMVAKSTFDMVNSVLTEPVNEALTKFEGWYDTAETVVKNGGGELPVDIKTVITDIASARKSMTLVNNVMAQLSRVA